MMALCKQTTWEWKVAARARLFMSRAGDKDLSLSSSQFYSKQHRKKNLTTESFFHVLCTWSSQMWFDSLLCWYMIGLSSKWGHINSPCRRLKYPPNKQTQTIVCCHLTDESSGGALSDPEAELPLLPLPQLSFCAGGDEHGVLVYQGLVKNLQSHKWHLLSQYFPFLCFTILTSEYTPWITEKNIKKGKNEKMTESESCLQKIH